MRIKKGFALRTVMGQNIVLAEGNNADSYDKIITLNPSAAWLWGELKGRQFTAAEAAERLAAEYGIDPTQAREDADYIIGKMMEKGLIEE